MMTDARRVGQVDFGSEAFLADPYPAYQWLREEAPVYWMPFASGYGGMWLVSRYDNVVDTLREPLLSKDFSRFAPDEALTPFNHAMLFRDPPDHTRLRGLVNLAFTPRHVEQLKPRIAALVDDLLAAMAGRQEVDFIADFALPLPVAVIAELLGVPREHGPQFSAWSQAIIAASDGSRINEALIVASQEAEAALGAYLTDLIAERRQRPQKDMISDLIRARDGANSLSEKELLGTCILLLVAGHETTVNLLGNGLLTLLRHPQQMALLRDNPDLAPTAVEEMLRYESPVQRATQRFAMAPLEIGGQEIEAGQQVSALLGAANRDVSRFSDPERFDIRRKRNRHLAFGFGIHFCLGAPLARVEAALAFPRLLQRFPDLSLLDEAPQWRANTFMRGLRKLRLAIGD